MTFSYLCTKGCVVSVFSYDVVFTADADTILRRFLDFSCRVVFSAEGFCWPDQNLAVCSSVSY